MRLALSSAAAPDLSLPDLLDACRRRGLAALELVGDHACFRLPTSVAVVAAEARAAAAELEVELAAVALPEPGALLERTLDFARGLRVPALVPVHHAVTRAERLRPHFQAGGRALLLHGSDPAVVGEARKLVESVPGGRAALAWEVDPARTDPAVVPSILAAAGPALRYVRLRGGGPEAESQTGMGVGAVMAWLALARYAGPLVLVPSDPRFHFAWRAWLGRAGGWGCGSKRSDSSLVVLTGTATP